MSVLRSGQVPKLLGELLAQLRAMGIRVDDGRRYLAGRSVSGTSYTIVDDDCFVLAEATGFAMTLTLPASAININRLLIIKRTSSALAVTVTRAGSDTIEGATTHSLSAQYDSVSLWTDGSGIWYIQATT